MSLLASLVCGAAVGQTASEALSLSDITSGQYSPTYIYGVTPMADGVSYSQLSADGTQIVRRSFKTGEQTDVLFDCATARGEAKLSRIDGYIMSPDESRILLRTQTQMIYRHSHTAVYYLYDVANRKYEPLSSGGPQQAPRFSPDGNLVAFVREGNLYLVKLLFGNAESQVTKDGKRGEVINGIPDWVYEEEFSTSSSFDFSADSKVLAWVRYDESRVPMFEMPMYEGQAPRLEAYAAYPGKYAYKYPVAGETNSTVTVHAFDIQSHVTRQIDLPLPADGYVPRIHFTSDPDKLAIVTLNRHQDEMNIYMANPRSRICQLSLREKVDKYVPAEAYTDLRFYDNRFVLTSDRSGYKHLYLYTLDGQLLRQLTKGDYDVAALYGYNPRTDEVFYASHEESPLCTTISVADKKGKVRRLSTERGANSAIFSADFSYYLNVYSSLTTAPRTTLCQTGRQQPTATLVDNAELTARAAARCGQKELFSFTTSDGVQLNGWMVKPHGFDASRRYPVVMYQYSGPGSQEVRDSWQMGLYGGGLYESYLADQGFIVCCVDGRGTGARGAAFEKCTYLHLGQIEAHDQAEAARYLATLPYVDGKRIGIWGWSFGGFNTLMALGEQQSPFAAGVAVAAPSSWRYYDTVYTERYMRTPGENAEGYADCPISRAARINVPLLLVHGTADDNVHYRNAAEMSEALVQADKDFEMQVYTNRNHFIVGGNSRHHLFRRITDFFTRTLRP